MLLRLLDSGRYALGGDSLTAREVFTRTRNKLENPRSLQLLLPAARCLVTTMPVAKQEARHLAKTLPWTLEERVLEPVEQLHVAHGPARDGSACVSAVNADWLRQVLADLNAAGLEPGFACSELFVLPWQAGQWTVFVPAADSPALVRHGAHAGFACARENLHTALQLLLNEHDEQPQRVVVIAEPTATVDSATLFPVMVQARLNLHRQTLEQLLQGASLPDCNLLQGRFAPSLPWAQWWRQWRVAAVLLAGLLLSDLALSAYDSWRLNGEAERMEAEILAMFRTVQPGAAAVDPRLQLEQALAATSASGGDGFLGLLSRMAPALQATPDARVQNLEFDGGSGELQLQLLTSDYAAAETLRVQLQQLGLRAELLGSNRVGNGSLTRLRVGGGA